MFSYSFFKIAPLFSGLYYFWHRSVAIQHLWPLFIYSLSFDNQKCFWALSYVPLREWNCPQFRTTDLYLSCLVFFGCFALFNCLLAVLSKVLCRSLLHISCGWYLWGSWNLGFIVFINLELFSHNFKKLYFSILFPFSVSLIAPITWMLTCLKFSHISHMFC